MIGFRATDLSHDLFQMLGHGSPFRGNLMQLMIGYTGDKASCGSTCAMNYRPLAAIPHRQVGGRCGQ